jgi:hypothetical protein
MEAIGEFHGPTALVLENSPPVPVVEDRIFRQKHLDNVYNIYPYICICNTD